MVADGAVAVHIVVGDVGVRLLLPMVPCLLLLCYRCIGAVLWLFLSSSFSVSVASFSLRFYHISTLNLSVQEGGYHLRELVEEKN